MRGKLTKYPVLLGPVDCWCQYSNPVTTGTFYIVKYYIRFQQIFHIMQH